ncbi:MAG: metallophosphoesterase [Bacteroidales bacterium]|nr:metallophosphoesterase [Bacteroidales bacterium]
MDLTKRDSESPFQYHKRIVYGKLVDGTLADLDYSELSELAYGKPYSGDVARRMFYGSRRTLELLDQERAPVNEEVTDELDEKIEELKREQQKFYDQRREHNKYICTEARTEHLYETLEQAALNLAETVGSIREDAIRIIAPDEESEAVLVLADWHYGLKTNNVFNKYDTDICRERVDNIIYEAMDRIALHKCNKLHVVVLGDLFHGAIHTSARVASEELVCDQMMQASEILAQAIEWLAESVPEVVVYTTYGNHARTVQNKKDNIHRDNMERLVQWWLAERLKSYDNIEVCDESDNEFILMDVCGHGIVATHGDLDSVQTSPRVLSTLFHKKFGKDIEYILLGDKHHRESYSELGCTALQCGSLCGSDDYANDKRLFSEPSQMLLIVNDRFGVDAEYRLRVE